MSVCINSAALDGIAAITIQIETRITPGIQYCIVGLPDESVKESLVRVESAISASGYHMPRQRIVISMAPAGFRKQGALFDLPIALSILATSGQIDLDRVNPFVAVGELSLNGKIRPVRGVLSMAIQAKKEDFKILVIPEENAAEAAVLSGLDVFAMSDLYSVVEFLKGSLSVAPYAAQNVHIKSGQAILPSLDLSCIFGQQEVKRAMEIAAAGGHNLLLTGPPGAGKTLMAKCLSTILPPMSLQESLEVTRIYSLCSQAGNPGLITSRPFRAPHHTASDISLIGGGSLAYPGEISLAHHGILFLDELPEFARRVPEVLRQPLEDKQITVSRANYNHTYPARFILVGAMNPCPCGYYGHPTRKCRCTLTAIRRYLQKISGPLLDRIDLHVKVLPVNPADIKDHIKNESSNTVRSRVTTARKIQHERNRMIINADLLHDQLKQCCTLADNEKEVLLHVIQKHQLSMRSYERILKVARTIADLEASVHIQMPHLAEAINFRSSGYDNFYF